jgi:cell division septum initiation protein DivIVA
MRRATATCREDRTMTDAETGHRPHDQGSIVPGFSDPDTEEIQQRRAGTGHFDRAAIGGYDRGQVDAYLAHVSYKIEELRSELAAAQQQAQLASADARRLRAELERGRPDAEVIGGRIGKMLALAEAEAEQVKAEAARQIQGVNAERTRILEDAQAHAESLVADARRHAAQLTEGARRDAAQTTEGARQDLEALAARRATVVADLQRAHQQLGQVIAQAAGQPGGQDGGLQIVNNGPQHSSVIELPAR